MHGAGFDGFDETTEPGGKHTWPAGDGNFTQSKHFATGGHSGAIGEKHWAEIAKFIVRPAYRPFDLKEPVGELFATEQDRFYKFLGALRIGVPSGFAPAALTVLLGLAWFLPDRWNIGVILMTVLWVGWLCAAGAYLAKSTSTPPPKAYIDACFITPWQGAP